MGSNKIVLFIRFLFEIIALVSFGIYGWKLGSGITSYLYAIGFPIIAAFLWGIFAVPDDPSRSGKAPVPTPGFIRLLIELMIFGLSSYCLIILGYNTLGILYIVIVVLHYVISYDRILWLVKQYKYTNK